MSRRRNGMTVAIAVALIAAGVALAFAPPWRTTVLATDSNDARRIRLARGGVAFEATVVHFDRGRVAARLADLAAGQSLADASGDATLAIHGGYFDAACAPPDSFREEPAHVEVVAVIHASRDVNRLRRKRDRGPAD